MNKVKIAIIGYGYWGKIWAEKILKNDSFELIGIVSKETIDSDKFKTIPQQQEDHLLADPTLNLVIITTAVKDHFNLVKRCLESGKNVLVAKPPFLNLAEYEEILTLKKRMNKEVYVENIYLFNPYFLKMKSLIRQRKIKYFQSIRCQFGKYQKQSNVIQELMFHDIFMLFNLIEKCELKPSHCQKVNINSTNSDAASLSLHFNEDVNAVLFSSFNSIRKNRCITISGDDFIAEWEESQDNNLEFANIIHNESDHNYIHDISNRKKIGKVDGDAIENFIRAIHADISLLDTSNVSIKLEHTYNVFKTLLERGIHVFN